jgi:putative transposase
MQAGLLGVSRSSLYYRAAPPRPEEVAVKHQIDRIYTAWPTSGSRRIRAQLRRDGYPVSRQRVQRYLREMGLEAIYAGPKTRRAEARSMKGTPIY